MRMVATNSCNLLSFITFSNYTIPHKIINRLPDFAINHEQFLAGRMLQHQRAILVAGTLVSAPSWVTSPIRESPTAQLGTVNQEGLIQTAEASVLTKHHHKAH